MDIATLAGLGIAIGLIMLGYVMEGGNPASLIGPTAMLIVFGGTIGATTLSYSLADMLALPKLFIKAIKPPPDKRAALVQEMIALADLARRDGLLALENRQIDDPFLKKAVMLIVDGTDQEVVESILLADVENMEARHTLGRDVFTTMGGYAPTMGVLGTVMGMVVILGNLSQPEELGHSIAVAFLATMYGVGSANVIFLPIAAKLKLRSKQEVQERMIVIEGAMALAHGDNPRVLKEKLTVYLPPALRNKPAPEAAATGASARAGAMATAEGGK